MYKLILDENYIKKEKKFFKKYPELLDRYKKLLHILRADLFYPSLRIRKLKGYLQEYHSVSINMSYRVIINFIIKENKIIFIDIGGHEIY